LCCARKARNEVIASIFLQGKLNTSTKNFGKSRLLDRTRSELTFTFFTITPSKVMAAIVKTPTLVHSVLPAKELDINVSVRLQNEN
jgi:hypothetical protein